MARPRCWVIDNYDYRPCRSPQKEFTAAVVLHTHSYHSKESLAVINEVLALPVLRGIRGAFTRSFRLKSKEELDFSDLHYSPPISSEEVYRLELEGVGELGFERMLLAITDHDKIAACQELLEVRPDLAGSSVISEELSFPFGEQVFHLNLIGIPAENADRHHKTLQEQASRGELDDLFELLRELGCLVILNHPFFPIKKMPNHEELLKRLWHRYGSMIHAVEYNGMRRREENELTLEFARWARKPVVGGGDRHTPIACLVISASHEATTFTDYIEEVKAGEGVVICKRDYFIPHGWKLFVRVLSYVKAFRQIIFYKNIPITSYAIDDRILPDYLADASSFLLWVFGKLGLVR